MTVVQNKTRILDFGFNTSLPKRHEIFGRRWANLHLLVKCTALSSLEIIILRLDNVLCCSVIII